MSRQTRRARRPNTGFSLTARSSVSAAVLLALYGIGPTAHADDPTGPDPQQSSTSEKSSKSSLQEVVVTAERVKETIYQIPSAISVVTPTALAQNSVVDIAGLTRETGIAGGGSVQGAAYTFPIIRGLNASPSISAFRIPNQAPVDTYIDNSAVGGGYFQLTDVSRIEILRGPQGTLYGAGALGGALRVIPNDPVLGKFSGNADAKIGDVDHAGKPTYTAEGMINVPLGDTLAFRASATYEYQPGYITTYGLLERGSNGVPLLADPSDPVNSPGIYTSEHNWNDEANLTGRAALLWQPLKNFTANLAFTYSNDDGNGASVVNPVFPGGPDTVDPRINLPAGGRFTYFSPETLPYSRRTDLTSLDLSYDAGFATVSSTTSYFQTGGNFESSPVYGLMQPILLPYVQPYAGAPINPRWVSQFEYLDSERTFSQELRMVREATAESPFGYVVGLYYSKEASLASDPLTDPGSPERSVAEGCTGPVYPGSVFPNCLLLTGPSDEAYNILDTQYFTDKSVYGDITYDFAKNWELTGGVRYFKESFADYGAADLYDYGISTEPNERPAPASKTVGRFAISYEYAPGQHAYALWSQGFRRGGANGLLLATGAFADEAPNTFGPDLVNNYEVGFKGHFENSMSYGVDAFYMPWKNPQICGLTPEANLACWNAKQAKSEGFELMLDTPLVLPGLRFHLEGTYANAHLTQNYTYPDYLGPIQGYAGEQLPLSPRVSAAATLSYTHSVGPDWQLVTTLNNTYTSAEVTNYFVILGQKPTNVPVLDLVDASVSLSNGVWSVGIYGTNVLNKYEFLSTGDQGLPLAYTSAINQPRVVYLKAGYAF
ncbi:MAG TPA: TonB-dependent receptor [Steroidobacteraceae bacterium]|nr:TonB-dependent receptor [Steroidobacteraceae bacterium]